MAEFAVLRAVAIKYLTAGYKKKHDYDRHDFKKENVHSISEEIR